MTLSCLVPARCRGYFELYVQPSVLIEERFPGLPWQQRYDCAFSAYMSIHKVLTEPKPP